MTSKWIFTQLWVNSSFPVNENSDYTNLLKQVYGDRVKMPFEYFYKSSNIRF